MLTKGGKIILKDMDMSKRSAVIAHATYGSLDYDEDRANRGMFDKSWSESKDDLRIFFNHNKEKAPGRPGRTWDDKDHAYTEIIFGTHTLGEDTLKQIDEKIIVAASYGFIPVKYREIKKKGQDFLEVKHMETSVLTHWGAHKKSGVVAVNKSLKLDLKQLSDTEAALLRRMLGNGLDSLQALMDLYPTVDVESDLYTAINYMISRQAEAMGDIKYRLQYGLKEATEFNGRVKAMQDFIKNTSASDESIQEVTKSLNTLLNKDSDTVNTDNPAMLKCPKCSVHFKAQADASGSVRCAECDHVIKDGQPNTSRKEKGDLRKRLLALKLQMSMASACDGD